MGARSGVGAAIAAAAFVLAGTAAHVQAADGNFFEMLFGVRPAPQPVQPAAPAASESAYRVEPARNTLRTRYAALPVKIRVSDRQTPIDMKQGAAAALLKDETLRPGDIVVLNSGARVFTGEAGRRHTMRDFEPVQRSAYVDRSTRRLLAGMATPAGVLPGDEARRMTARVRVRMPDAVPVATARSAEMRVINPWLAAP